MTREQVADKVREYIYMANPYNIEYIENVQITNSPYQGKYGYGYLPGNVKWRPDALFSEVTVNGQPHSPTTFEGTVNITPRPIAKSETLQI